MDIIKKQLELFHTIQSNYKNKRSFITSINKLLPYQKSSLYKRLRGDASLTINELIVLAQKYNLSLDAIYELKTDCVVFEYPKSISNPNDTHSDYLQQLQAILFDANQQTEMKLKHQANEMPFFYYLKFPELAFFKMFIYFNTAWKNPDIPIQKFDLKKTSTSQSTKTLMKDIHMNYVHIQRKEYWPSNPYYYIVLQLFSLLKDKMFANNEDAMVLLNSLLKLNQYVANNVVNSVNKKQNTLDLYINELNAHNNMILVESQSDSFLLKSLNSPNLLKSKDYGLINLTQQWFDRTEDLSVCLTKGNRLKLPNYFKNQEQYLLRAKEQLTEHLKFLEKGLIY